MSAGTLPGGINLNYDPDEGNNCSVCNNIGSATISGGNTVLTVDFGYVGSNSISGLVWHDDDDNASLDGGEDIRYNDVVIHLWDCGADACGSGTDDVYLGFTSTRNDATEGDGYYIFDNLPNGNYRVIVNRNAQNLQGLNPTVTTSPTTYHDVTLSSSNSTGNNFGFLSSIDFGDLPSAYDNTLTAKNGARHIITSNLYLV